jgi:hypothetical protein
MIVDSNDEFEQLMTMSEEKFKEQLGGVPFIRSTI